jgi:hypothetical protein
MLTEDIYVRYKPQNKQRKHPYVSLNYGFLQPTRRVFTVRYELNLHT